MKKRVLVTGASKGIGRSVCERLMAEGYEVVGVARSRPGDLPAGLEFHEVDLSDRAAIAAFLQHPMFEQAFYGLVNNVGMVPEGRLEAVSMEELHKAIQLNIEVAIQFTQAVIGRMRQARIGRVVNISSRAALGKMGRTIYSMTKAGLIGITRTWALEAADAGITVNAVAPGPIATSFFNDVNDPASPRTQALLNSIPVGRMGQPEDVAHAVVYFIDPRSGFVTGQTHFVCGGITIGAA